MCQSKDQSFQSCRPQPHFRTGGGPTGVYFGGLVHAGGLLLLVWSDGLASIYLVGLSVRLPCLSAVLLLFSTYRPKPYRIDEPEECSKHEARSVWLGLGAVDSERSPFPPSYSSSYVDSLTRGSALQCGVAAGGHLPWSTCPFYPS
jgi:hypothetical protein